MKKRSNYAVVIYALLGALFFRTFIVSVYKIPTNSMKPTFLPGDFILASRISYGLQFPWTDEAWFASAPARGDLVVVKFKGKPGITYIKRVIAVAGENVTTADGSVVTVPQTEIYVASDNREINDDSKEGFASLVDVDSQAKIIWYSASKESGIRWKRIFNLPK